MKQEQAFLGDILEHPDDDTPRLVFADWLDDHDQPDRARLIRGQIELSGMDCFDERHPDLAWEMHDLLRRNAPWGKPLHKFTKRIEFVRGFVGKMTIPAAKFHINHVKIFESCPLRHLRLLKLERAIEGIASSPGLARLRTLDVHGCRLGVARVSRLIGSSHIAQLEELNLSVVSMRGSGALAVLRSPNIRNLRMLRMSHNSLNADFVAELVKLQPMPRLIHLELSGNPLGVEGARMLDRCEKLAGIEVLELASTLPAEGITDLFAGHGWPALRKLDLTYCPMNVANLAVIAGRSQSRQLVELKLGQVQEPGGLDALLDSPHLKRLRSLDLTTVSASEEELHRLLDSDLVKQLRVLRFPHRLPERVVHRVFDSPALAGLFELSLPGIYLPGRGVAECLGSASHLKRLVRLDLHSSGLHDDGLVEVAANPHFERLEHLNVDWCGLGAPSYQALLDSPCLKRLRHISVVGQWNLPQSVMAGLRERFEEVKGY